MLIAVHGGHSDSISCYGYMLPMFHHFGVDVLLPDMRAWRKSEGNRMYGGLKEQYDVAQWAREVICRRGEDVEIIIHGCSLDGLTAFMAAALTELPHQVVGLIGDCPYPSIPGTFANIIPRPLGVLALPLCSLWFRLFAGFSISDCTALPQAKNIRVPVLMICGQEDIMVPLASQQELYGSLQTKKRMWVCPRDKHCTAYLLEPAHYEEEIKAHIVRCSTVTPTCLKS